MISQLQRCGRKGIDYLAELGYAGNFLLRTVWSLPCWRKRFNLLSEELYKVGVLSLVIIIVSGLFIGMVVGLQGYNTLNKFGSTAQLGQVVALSISRELGPVMTALLFAGRAGSALTAEIGLMKATEQLSSMEMMGVDSLWQVIWPRFWAGIIAMPILATIFTGVAIYGGFFVGVQWLGIDCGIFWNNMQNAVSFRFDVMSGITKSVVFGFVVTWIAVFQGFAAEPTAEGIGQATTRTVVYSSVAILALDFILTTIMIGGW